MAKKSRLSHVIAITKDVKTAANSELSKLYKALAKADLFKGQTKAWTPAEEDGIKYQEKDILVQKRTDDVLDQCVLQWTNLMDAEATRDFANMGAFASVEVDGVILLADAPVPFLLSLEKQLKDMAGVLARIPELDPSEPWAYDDGTRMYRGKPTETYKSKKVKTPRVVVEATEKHPAQWTELTEDIIEGTWVTTNLSGCMSASKKKAMLEKVNKLRQAVHIAREEANSSPAPAQAVGKPLFEFILS